MRATLALWGALVAVLTSCGPSIDPGIPPLADPTNRAAVVEAYRPALQLKADAAHGKVLFEETCAKCHRPRKDGIQVGPDLGALERRQPADLLESILNPGARIDARYRHVIVRTVDGDVDDGLLAQAAPEGITLRDNESDRFIARSRIAAQRDSDVSLMPEGIEKGLGRQAIADLIAYVVSLPPAKLR
jgi:putative heme-binding domain-containing protein